MISIGRNEEGLSISVKMAIWITFLVFLFQIFFGFIFGFLSPVIENEQFVMLFLSVFSLGLPLLWLMKRYGSLIKPLRRVEHLKWHDYIILLILFAGTIIVSSEIMNMVSRVFPMPEMWVETFEMLAGENILTALIGVGLIIPVLEELIFRGIILSGLNKAYSSATAVMFSSLLFAVLHLNPWQGLPALFMGIVFGWAMIKTNSLLIPIIGHIFNNVVFIFAQFFFPQVPGLTDMAYVEHHFPLTFLGVILIIIGIRLFPEKS